MADTILVDDLVQLVRDDIDEANITDIDDSFILKKLNKAQRIATNKVIRRYDELFLVETGSGSRSDTTTTSGTVKYALPTDIFGTRLENVTQVHSDGTVTDLTRVRKQTAYEWSTSYTTEDPRKYCVVHRDFEIYPPPAAGLTLRLLYTRIPETLVMQQGRITVVGADYVMVDELGDDLTTSVSDNNCFVNFIDPRTGNVRGSAQISALNTTTGKLTIKTASLTKSTVLGKTISTSLPSTLAVDDYVCVVRGTCIPELPEAYTDYLVQHAVVAIKRLKGEPTQEDFAELKDQESDLVSAWSGMEQKRQVRIKNTLRYRRRY